MRRNSRFLIALIALPVFAQTPTGGIVANTNAAPGFYVLANSGIIFRDDAGREIWRVWGTDPIDANYNTANLYLGYEAGLCQPTANDTDSGYYNTGVGFQTLRSIGGGVGNTAMGDGAAYSMTNNAFNTAIGFLALFASACDYLHCYDNVAVGASAMLSNASGRENTALGTTAMYYSTSGERNLAVGAHAGHSLTTGNLNVLIGPSIIPAAYEQLTTGSHNISIGANVAVPSQTGSYQMSIGNLIYGTGVDGEGQDISSGNIGIGVKNPTKKLDVGGDAKVRGLAGHGRGYVCVEDDGTLFWSETPCR